MRYIPGIFLFACLLSGVVIAQTAPDDSSHPRSLANFGLRLDHSLQNAPVTPEERTQIYTVIDKAVHGSFTDDQREEERKAVLSSRVGLAALADTDNQQILVRGPKPSCGTAGDCPLWIFIRELGQVRLILDDEGNGFFAGSTLSQGFKDVVVPFHHSASETSFSVYRWNAREYKRIDCYSAILDPVSGKPSAIRDCAKPDLNHSFTPAEPSPGDPLPSR
jgi:hypothetical protein